MKKAITLIEVLVAVFLITIVIGSMIQMKSNNLYMLDRFKDSALTDSYISLTAATNNMKDETIFLSDIVRFDDDNLRRDLKDIKIIVKHTEDNDIKIPENDYISSIKTIISTYQIEDKSTKVFYKFQLEY
jgi:hypothetical protein